MSSTPYGDPTRLTDQEREASLIVYDNPQFDEHQQGPGHPECPERLLAIRRALQPCGWPVRPGRPATRDELERVHSPAYVRRVLSLRGCYDDLDPDTSTSPGSVDAALLAAGAAVEAAELTLAGRNCFVTCRPPGHHATPSRAMGFCLFNNAAVAAAHLCYLGYKVVIFDPDVHHGNGTQDIFHQRSDVFYVSMHRYPFYPGSGASTDTGRGEGLGCTMNIPLFGGADDDIYLSAFQRLVLPAMERFAPDVCIISAGFDAMEGDLLGGMLLTRPALASMGAALVARWPVMAVLEGGYNTQRLGNDVRCLAETLAGEPAPEMHIDAPPAWVRRLAEWQHPLLD